MRSRGVQFTSPLFRADNLVGNMREFFHDCSECSDPSSAAYIDVIAFNPFCGS